MKRSHSFKYFSNRQVIFTTSIGLKTSPLPPSRDGRPAGAAACEPARRLPRSRRDTVRGRRDGWFGAAAVERARCLLREFRAAEEETGAAVSGHAGTFRVTATPVWMRAAIAPTAAAFRELAPGVGLILHTAPFAEGLRLLEDGGNDLHFGGPDPGHPLPAFLWRERFLDLTAGIVAPAGHPLLGTAPAPGDLAAWPWIDFDAPAPAAHMAATPAADGSASLEGLLDRLFRETSRRAATVLRAGAAGLSVMAGGPWLARLPLEPLDWLPGLELRPLDTAFGRHRYRTGIVARRAAGGPGAVPPAPAHGPPHGARQGRTGGDAPLTPAGAHLRTPDSSGGLRRKPIGYRGPTHRSGFVARRAAQELRVFPAPEHGVSDTARARNPCLCLFRRDHGPNQRGSAQTGGIPRFVTPSAEVGASVRHRGVSGRIQTPDHGWLSMTSPSDFGASPAICLSWSPGRRNEQLTIYDTVVQHPPTD